MRILVTGATGNIGRMLVDHLVAAGGCTVRALTVEVMERAQAARIGHVVDLSGEHESWWGSVARAVEAAGLPWTHLSPGDFMENTETWADQIRSTGGVSEPHPGGASAPIAMDDIAAVAAAVLLAGPDRYGGADAGSDRPRDPDPGGAARPDRRRPRPAAGVPAGRPGTPFAAWARDHVEQFR